MPTLRLADNLRFLRQRQQLSQQSLAEALGFSRSHIASYEGGKAEPGLRKALAFSAFFDVDLRQLLSEDLPLLAARERLMPCRLAEQAAEQQARCRQGHHEAQAARQRHADWQQTVQGFRAFHHLRQEAQPEGHRKDVQDLLGVMDKMLLAQETLLQSLERAYGLG